MNDEAAGPQTPQSPAVEPATGHEVEMGRGLIVNTKHAHRFFSSGKVWELKTTKCRTVPKNAAFWVVESGIGQNSEGLAVFRILGSLFLRDVQPVTFDQLMDQSTYDKHCCCPEELRQLKTQWKNKNLYAWAVEVSEVLRQPVYIRGNQDWGS